MLELIGFRLEQVSHVTHGDNQAVSHVTHVTPWCMALMMHVLCAGRVLAVLCACSGSSPPRLSLHCHAL
jgi:hypothetical protein